MKKRSESQLEEMLRELPKITDDRHPSEIYQRIRLKTKKRRVPTWFLPSIAASAVVLLLFILSPTLTGWQNEANLSESSDSSGLDNSAMLERTEEINEPKDENTALVDEGNAREQNGEENRSNEASTAALTSVYSSDLDSHQAFTYPIPDHNAQVLVPITVLIDKTADKTWYEQFEETMPKLKEEKWGLAEYYPLNAKFKYNEGSKIVSVDVPANHQYGIGSASETMFVSTLSKLFPTDYVNRILFTTEGREGITLGNYGEQFELENVRSKGHAYFFYYNGEETQPYIVPTGETYESVSDALTDMKVDQVELGLKASIPAEINIDVLNVDQANETLNIQLENGAKLNDDFIYSLEAITLTAKNFGYETVKFDNTDVAEIGPYDLSEEIKVPVAPNKKIINDN